jgi:hypothetical protein
MNCFIGAYKSNPEFWNDAANHRLFTWWIPRDTEVRLKFHYRHMRKRFQRQPTAGRESSKDFNETAGKFEYPFEPRTQQWPQRFYNGYIKSIPNQKITPIPLVEIRPVPTGLKNLLLSYPTLTSLTSFLHYSDCINLSMVAKDIRSVMIPPSELANRLQFFKRECACEDIIDTTCYGCRVGLCSVSFLYFSQLVTLHLENPRSNLTNQKKGCLCSKTDNLSTHITPHFECTPICTPCLLSAQLQNAHLTEIYPPTNRRTWKYCNSSHSDTAPKTFCNSCYTAVRLQSVACREQLKMRIVDRDRVDLLENGSKELSCEECRRKGNFAQMALPENGPRWWFCTHCHGECVSDLHPPWADKKLC